MKSIEERFWAKVNKTEGCWLWTASLRNKGYGAFGYTINGKTIQDRAHRYSYRLNIGPIPPGMFVLHRCDTPACVNPDHLFLGTNQDNVTDMMRKQRHVPGGTYCGDNNTYQRGINHHAAIFTENDIREIRRLYAVGGMSYSQIGAMYGVRQGTIGKIVTRIRWKHVD